MYNCNISLSTVHAEDNEDASYMRWILETLKYGH